MLKISTLSVLLLLSTPALAIYKCESNGKLTYSDVPCHAGKALPLGTSIQDKISATEVDAATQRAADQKKELDRVEKERRQVDALDAREQKERQKLAKADAAQKRKCAALALRQKWSDEDAAAATGRSAEKSKRAARRQAEKYQMECGK